MTDKELILSVLDDRSPHSLEEIEMVAQMRRGRRITVHSRVADLRREGWDIRALKHGAVAGYQLVGTQKGESVRVVTQKQEPVQGFVFESVAEDREISTRNGNICQVVRRANSFESSETEVLDYGPAFVVRFGDGKLETAYSSELRPWYPT